MRLLNQMTIYGYARVSTDGQTLAAQDAALHAAGCAKVYGEKISGARSDRPELAKLLKRLEPGDVLMVTRLDRLARSTRDLLNILHQLGERGVGFKSLADAWADTTTPHGRLLVTMLAGIAEFERELIKARTGEGRKRAQARGVKFGRPPATDSPPASGSASAPCCGRDANGYCAELQRLACDHWEAARPFFQSRKRGHVRRRKK
jgi:DNA invertase Pin-like site-specific DNA recombinase